MTEISKNFKICSKQISEKCVKMGSPDKFPVRSRVCKQCQVEQNKGFYAANREKYLDKARVNSKIRYDQNKEAKIAQVKKNYALKKQKLTEVKSEVVEANE
jgi:uncharacterized protein with FMN-binding domain